MTNGWMLMNQQLQGTVIINYIIIRQIWLFSWTEIDETVYIMSYSSLNCKLKLFTTISYADPAMMNQWTLMTRPYKGTVINKIHRTEIIKVPVSFKFIQYVTAGVTVLYVIYCSSKPVYSSKWCYFSKQTLFHPLQRMYNSWALLYTVYNSGQPLIVYFCRAVIDSL